QQDALSEPPAWLQSTLPRSRRRVGMLVTLGLLLAIALAFLWLRPRDAAVAPQAVQAPTVAPPPAPSASPVPVKDIAVENRAVAVPVERDLSTQRTNGSERPIALPAAEVAAPKSTAPAAPPRAPAVTQARPVKAETRAQTKPVKE